MDSLLKFQVVGFMPSPEFQKVCFYLENLHKFFPDKIAKPNIRPMLNVDWEEYLNNLRRLKGAKTWQIQKVVVLYNDDVLGDDEDFFKYLTKCIRIKFKGVDFQDLGCEQLVEHLNKLVSKNQRDLVYLMVSVNCKFLGTLLFMLYSDLVPNTCFNFMELRGVGGGDIHRIVKNGWTQFQTKHFKIPRCGAENYIVPHDRRGVLSMCLNKSRTKANFFITFQPSQWMDKKFVAFGQLIQGAEVLNKIETMANITQAPMYSIKIEEVGEYSLEFYKRGQIEVDVSYSDFKDVTIGDDQESLNETKFRKGLYCLSTDVLGMLQGLGFDYDLQEE